MFNKLLIVSLLTISTFALEGIWSDLTKSGSRLKRYPKIIKTLVENKLYHTAVPYVKEYLVSSSSINQREFDSLLEEVVTHVGDRQFVLLPEKYLQRANSPTLKYLLAKKLLRRRKLTMALQVLNATIPADHSVKPFALMLEGTIFSYRKSYASSINAFKRCVSKSEDMISSADTLQRKRQLVINKDYCLAGIARTNYAAKNFEAAEFAYLDIEKQSYIWPELLVEEAWNSFYKGDYNRTLGKLVTYNAPILNFVVDPEIDVLKAMAFYKMCLYDDAVKVVENFYSEFEKPTQGLGKLIDQRRKKLKYYFLLINSYKEGKRYGAPLVNDILKAVLLDPAFLNLYESYVSGKEEASKIKTVKNLRLRRILTVNLRDSLILHQKLIGSYVKRQLRITHAQLQKAFMGMSYIKLEVLSQKKQRLYSGSTFSTEKRGDVQYLKRNEKQYFWSFNGEFWADELGDYVFALKSECSK